MRQSLENSLVGNGSIECYQLRAEERKQGYGHKNTYDFDCLDHRSKGLGQVSYVLLLGREPFYLGDSSRTRLFFVVH
jgi:hypothetical protein